MPKYDIKRRGDNIEIVFPGPGITFTAVFSRHESYELAHKIIGEAGA
jgi:hypothetical protein